MGIGVQESKAAQAAFDGRGAKDIPHETRRRPVKRLLMRQLRDPVYANGYALVLNSVLASALGFAFWLVAARRFAPDDLGWGAAVVSAATLAALIGKAGFDAAIIRFGPTARDRVLKKLLVYATLASVTLTAAVCLVILWLAGRGMESLAPLRTQNAAAGFLVLACGTAAAWVLDAFFIAEQTAILCLARNTAFNLVKLVVPFLVAASFASFAVPLSWGAGLGVSLIVAAVVIPWSLRRRRIDHAPSPSKREVATYAAKNYVLNVSEFLPGLVLPLLVLESMGAATNARFFLAWTIATVGFLGSKAIAQSSFAALVRDGPPQDALRKALRLSAIVLVPFGLGLLLGAPLLPLLFGEASGADSIALLRILALSLAPIAITNVFVSYLKARHAGWELTLLPAATLVAFLALAPLALATMGMAGVGWIWLIVQSVAGAYSAARLVTILRRTTHGTDPTRIGLGHRAHQG